MQEGNRKALLRLSDCRFVTALIGPHVIKKCFLALWHLPSHHFEFVTPALHHKGQWTFWVNSFYNPTVYNRYFITGHDFPLCYQMSTSSSLIADFSGGSYLLQLNRHSLEFHLVWQKLWETSLLLRHFTPSTFGYLFKTLWMFHTMALLPWLTVFEEFPVCPNSESTEHKLESVPNTLPNVLYGVPKKSIYFTSKFY